MSALVELALDACVTVAFIAAAAGAGLGLFSLAFGRRRRDREVGAIAATYGVAMLGVFVILWTIRGLGSGVAESHLFVERLAAVAAGSAFLLAYLAFGPGGLGQHDRRRAR